MGTTGAGTGGTTGETVGTIINGLLQLLAQLSPVIQGLLVVAAMVIVLAALYLYRHHGIVLGKWRGKDGKSKTVFTLEPMKLEATIVRTYGRMEVLLPPIELEAELVEFVVEEEQDTGRIAS